MKNLKQEIERLTLEELMNINSFVIDCIKAKRTVRAKQKIKNLRNGQRVNVKNRNGITEFTGTITKVKRTRVVVTEDDSTKRWNVPVGLIEVIKE